MDVHTSEVGVRALRLDLSRYLAEVRRGAEIVVTDRGRPIARLTPVHGSSTQRLAELIAKGQAEPPSVPKDDWLPDLLELPDGATVSDLVSDQRR